MKTLFYGGKILTMSAPLYVDAVMIEDGKIIDMGDEAELRMKYRDYEEKNLCGAAMLPGFIDAHSHFIQAAMSFMQVDLNGAETYEEIDKRIKDFIKENELPSGSFINACGYDNNSMPGYKNPPLDVINGFAPGHPLIIHHKSGHMGLMNSEAMKFFGITDDITAPAGGKIGKENGHLTGYFEENAYFTYLKSSPMPDFSDILAGVKKAQKKYASYGIVTAHEGMVAKEMIPLYTALVKNNILDLDVKLYMDKGAYDDGIEMLKDFDSDKVKISGIKIFLDGSPQGRTAWLRKPYADDENYSGYGTLKDEEVIAAFNMAAERKTQLIAHSNGDAAIEQFLRCLEIAEKTHPELKELRPVIIHGQLMGRDQLKKAKKLGAMVSFFVAHTYHWGDVHIRNFGFDRASNISPAGSALAEGVKFTFHQDTPVIEPDMLETLWCAENRITKDGVQLSETERISRFDALNAITVNGAWQYFEEENSGDISVGKKADFVVLDQDPLSDEVKDLRDIKVLKTYKGGKCIFSR